MNNSELLARIDERTENMELRLENVECYIGECSSKLTQITTTIYGKNSDKGLCGWVDDIQKELDKVKKVAYSAIGALTLAVGIVELIEFIA